MIWRRYRFETKSVEDYRPLKFNPCYPWWCSGYGDNTATIIAWLPDNEDLYQYWDDADNVDYQEHNEIKFSDRFPKPEYFKDLTNV